MLRFQGKKFQKNLELVHTSTDAATKKAWEPCQLVLAWLIVQGENIFVISGTRRVKYLEENVGALAVTISKDDDKALRKLVDTAEVNGESDISFSSYMDTSPLE